MRSDVLETIGLDGLILRVEFLWHSDRFRHVISTVADDGRTFPVLESIEGSLADEWPPGPPLQSLHLEAWPDGSRVALLVGMAGKSHWSASIGPLARGELTFDLACRTGGLPGPIESNYRLAGGAALLSIDDHAAELQVGGCFVRVAGSAEGTTLTQLLIDSDGHLKIQPQADSESSLKTLRWMYHVNLSATR